MALKGKISKEVKRCHLEEVGLVVGVEDGAEDGVGVTLIRSAAISHGCPVGGGQPPMLASMHQLCLTRDMALAIPMVWGIHIALTRGRVRWILGGGVPCLCAGIPMVANWRLGEGGERNVLWRMVESLCLLVAWLWIWLLSVGSHVEGAGNSHA